jgi:hypothetical protein
MPNDREDLQLLSKLYGTLNKVGTGNEKTANTNIAANRAGFQSYQILQKLVNAYPEESGYREDFARNLEAVGGAPNLRKALDLWTKLAAEFPGEPKYRLAEARGHRLLASGSDGDQHFGKAVALLSRLVADFPREPDYRIALARAHFDWAKALKDK